MVLAAGGDTAGIDKGGAVIAGRLTEIDGYASRTIRVITHFHSDHILGLKKSVESASMIIATPATHEALEALGYRVPLPKSVKLRHGEVLRVMEDSLILVKSRHVFGSAQVLVELRNGTRIGYTGDFKLPGTPVMKDLDVLVIDATYGSKRMVRPFEDEVESCFIDIVSSSLARGIPVRVLGYYGKLQEAMNILRKGGVRAPFLMNDRIYKLSQVAVKHGVYINDFHRLGSQEAEEIVRSGWYVLFQHANARRRFYGRGVNIYLSGWLFSSPARRLRSGFNGEEWWIAFSDHSDYRGTFAYVEEARPRMVIVDSFRAGRSVAEEFANSVRRELGLKAVALPEASGRTRKED